MKLMLQLAECRAALWLRTGKAVVTWNGLTDSARGPGPAMQGAVLAHLQWTGGDLPQ